MPTLARKRDDWPSEPMPTPPATWEDCLSRSVCGLFAPRQEARLRLRWLGNIGWRFRLHPDPRFVMMHSGTDWRVVGDCGDNCPATRDCKHMKLLRALGGVAAFRRLIDGTL